MRKIAAAGWAASSWGWASVAATATAAVIVLAAFWLPRPQSSAEWAAWVQAAGVLLALAWGVGVLRRASVEESRRAGQVAGLFAANMHWVFRELSDACAKRSWDDFRVHRRILEEVLAQGRSIPLERLDGRRLAMVSALRGLGVEALELSEAHAPEGRWAELYAHFDHRLARLAAWLSTAGCPPDSSGPTDDAGLRSSFGAVDRH